MSSRAILAFFGAGLAALSANGANIITRTGTTTFIFGGANEYVSWTQTGTFSGVAIQANLVLNGGAGTGTAYLTTQIGAGTTTAQQVATAPVSISNTNQQSLTTLFSGLTLGPGTYYVTVSRTSGLDWVFSNAAITTVGIGVTANRDGGGNSAPYPPSATFFNKGQIFLFSATSTPLTAVSTPALSPWAILLTVFLLLSSGLWMMKFYRPQM